MSNTGAGLSNCRESRVEEAISLEEKRHYPAKALALLNCPPCDEFAFAGDLAD